MTGQPTYRFEALPTIGALHLFTFARGDQQPYTVDAVAPWHRSDGKASAIITWHTCCASCGASVIFKRGLAGRIDIRRCPACINRRLASAIRKSNRRPKGWRGKENS